MGSGKSKPGGLPPRARPSGETSSSAGAAANVGSGDSAPKQQELTVSLVRIDPAVHANTSVGTSITVQSGGGGFQVMTAAGRLGNIPPRHDDTLRGEGFRTGIVSSLETNPLTAQVRLRR